MEKVITVETMRKSDAYTIANYIDSKKLMYKAGVGVFNSYDYKGNIAIVCGSGNNAGDGYVLSLLLKEKNISSTLFLIKEKFSVDGKYYFDKCMEQNIPYKVCDEDTDFSDYGIIVDCIFGTGFKGVARGIAGDIIDKINDSNKTVISVDINSGLNGDTGFGEKVVKSDLTVSIGYLKTGLLINDADKYIGSLKNCNIDIELVGDYYTLVDDFSNAENVVEFNNFNSFTEEYNIIEYTNPLEVATEIAKENDINILIKNLGKYSFLVTDKVKELSRC